MCAATAWLCLGMTPALDVPHPVTVPLRAWGGHLFVNVIVDGNPMNFLVDTAATAIFLDREAAKRFGLEGDRAITVRGAESIRAYAVPLGRIDVGGALLSVPQAAVVDLRGIEDRGSTVDGILGMPFFRAAEVRIDPTRLTMTVARPGSLPASGTAVPVGDADGFPDVEAQVDGVKGRFLIDTGNNTELLLFDWFVRAHPGVAPYAGNGFVTNRGVGGSSAAVPAVVSRLGIGPFTLYNRYAAVILSSTGAFADRIDAGNIGWGSLRNFILTFDFGDRVLTLEPAPSFDDGRFRYQTEPLGNR